MRKALITVIALAAVAVPATASRSRDGDQARRHLDHGRQRPARRRDQAADRQEGPHRPARRSGPTSGTQVHLHGYNIEKNVKKGVPTVIQFVAKVPGRFDLELHPIGRRCSPS